jgi:pyruvate dehydrogenase (quinone)
VPNVAETIVAALARLGVRTVWGVVGDALNPVTDAIRRQDGIDWIGVRHEEVGAFAAGAQAQLSGTLGVCMGTVGPGAIHLLNGLYDAKKSSAPVLAICGQVPRAEIGSEYFQEVDNDLLFTDVADFRATVSSPEQMPRLLEQAVNAAFAGPGVAVLTIPGDVGELDVPGAEPSFVVRQPVVQPAAEAVDDAVRLIDEASAVTILAGIGAAHAREDLLALADRLQAPMVLTIKAKAVLEEDNRFEVGQSGLIGNPASKTALDGADLLLMIGTDFPYPDWLPQGTTTIQIDRVADHIGRRTRVDVGLVADTGAALEALLPRVAAKTDGAHLSKSRDHYRSWIERQDALTAAPGRPAGSGGAKQGSGRAKEGSVTGRVLAAVRGPVENPTGRIRPERLATVVDRIAGDDAVFTTDTGMATVWLSRFVRMRGTRRLIGSYNLGSMANALPQALGAQALDRDREVIAFCGDGGLTMLMGDLITAVEADLPITVVVFDNGRLGMVKLEQEQVGLPEFGTVLSNPDLAAVARAVGWQAWRVEDDAHLEDAVAAAFSTPGPVLLDVLTNPDEVALPPKASVHQAWGFAVAKVKETLVSPGDS